MATKIISKKEVSFFEEIGLATFKDGFLIGTFIAIILQLGIIQVASPFERILVFLLLILGIAIAIYRTFKRKSLISPPWDGFVSGFGVILGIANILETYVIPSL